MCNPDVDEYGQVGETVAPFQLDEMVEDLFIRTRRLLLIGEID